MKLTISIQEQVLHVLDDHDHIQKSYAISTAAKGIGQEKNSEQTPLGWHYIRAKIGEGYPENTVFVGRRATGEIYLPSLREQFSGCDWILTRILWLCGLERGKNRCGNVDTMQRYIYIHGTPDEVQLGQPGSRGCIRMRNVDIIELFDDIALGTRLFIEQ